MPVGRRVFLVVWAFVVSLCAGCGEGLPYVMHLLEGQMQVQGNVEPIADVLASGRLTDEQQAKLELVVAVRQFAVDSIGLTAGDSYTLFYDTQGDPLAFNLSAARRDALVPVTWRFPIVGEVPYLSFFDEDYLRRIERQLIEDGYDTMTYELDAYSTLGVFADPVRSTMLERGELSLIETIIHELLHNTIWRPGETVFNESLATFVGQRGAIDFLRAYYGDESGWPELAEAYYADRETINAFLVELYADLEAYYAGPGSGAQKIAGRAAVFERGREHFTRDVQPGLHFPDLFSYLAELPVNNAWMLANRRYNLNLDVFAAVHDVTGGRWADSLAVFRAAAESAGDPFEYLRNRLTE